MVKQTDSRKSTATDRKTRRSKSSKTTAPSKDFLDLDAIEQQAFDEMMAEAVRKGELKPSKDFPAD